MTEIALDRQKRLALLPLDPFPVSSTPVSLDLQPIDFHEACEFIRRNHSHHGPPVGWKFGIAVNDGERIVGIVTVGRPVSRHLDNGYTLEVTRCCTDETKCAASKLYAAAWRAVKALGYKRLITYTLKSEAGTSLLAAGWKVLYETKGGSWNVRSRPRIDKHPIEQKKLWEAPAFPKSCGRSLSVS